MKISRRGVCSMMVGGLVALKRGLIGSGTTEAGEAEPAEVNREKIVLPAGRVTTAYQYDDLGRLVSVTESDESDHAPVNRENIASPAERITTVWDYDDLTRAVNVTEYHQPLTA